MSKLKIFSLNSMGIPLAPNRKVRFKLICKFIKKTNPDFVMLQEIGDIFLFKSLKKELGDVYHFYPDKITSLVNRNGALLFLSKYPLAGYKFIRYSVTGGSSFPFSLVEKLSNKGLQICKTKVNGKLIIIIHTHLLASFFNSEKEYQLMKIQLRELIKIIKSYSKKHMLIIGGDFNFSPENFYYKYFLEKTKCNDPLSGKTLVTHQRSNLNLKKIAPFFSKLNWGDKREDYIFLKSFSDSAVEQKIIDKKFHYNSKLYDLSDHYGIFTELNI